MTKRATCVARTVLLIGGMCLLGATSGLAQAGIEAGMAGAASSSAASAAGKATSSALGSVLGQNGMKGTANAPDSGAPAAAPKNAPPAKTQIAPPQPTSHDMPKFISKNPLSSDDGSADGPPPQIHFDSASFQRCNGGVASSKVDLPLDGDTIAYHCQSVFQILYFAYTGVTASKLTLGGYPAWVESDLYNFEAKVAPDDAATWRKMSLNERRAAVRGLLAESLKLKVKINTTPRAVYTLQVATDGTKLKAHTDGEQQRLPNGLLLHGRDMSWVGRVAYFQDASMSNLAELLSSHLDRQVLNLTGLTGGYDFSLPLPYGTGTSANADLAANIPSVAKLLSDLGLKLEAGKADVGGLIVEHIERPAED